MSLTNVGEFDVCLEYVRMPALGQLNCSCARMWPLITKISPESSDCLGAHSDDKSYARAIKCNKDGMHNRR